MNLDVLLSELSKRNVSIWSEGDRLHIKAPKGAVTEELHNGLKEHKEQLLLHLRDNRPIQKLPLGKSGSRLPLSLAQQRMWNITRIVPDPAAYNIVFAINLSGKLNVEALKRALELLTGRHGSLRTSYLQEHSVMEASQVIASNCELIFKSIDLRQLPEPERDSEVRRLVAESSQWPFDLSSAPLVRQLLLRLSEDSHILLVTTHNIVMDAASIKIFHSELSSLYEICEAGTPVSLPELPIQYADFACWQRERLSDDDVKGQVAYWKSELSDLPPGISLPAGTGIGEPQKNTLVITLGPDILNPLKELCRSESVTLFTALLTAFLVVLRHHSRQNDLVVGIPTTWRTHPDVMGLIGYFTNILPLRSRAAGDPSFLDFLEQSHVAVQKAQVNKDVSFEKLASMLPRFSLQVLFNMLPGLFKSRRFSSGLNSYITFPKQETATVDLLMYVTEEDNNLWVVADYNKGLFSSSAIAQIINDFETVLKGITVNPGLRLSEFELSEALYSSADHYRLEKPKDRKMTSISPRNETEHRLSEIWEDILSVGPIGVTDDFFELGGNSISIMRLMTRFEQEFGKAFPIVKFHQSPTIEQMASVVSLTDEDSSDSQTDSTAHQQVPSTVKHRPPIKQFIRKCIGLLPYPLMIKLSNWLLKRSWVQKWFLMRFYRTEITNITDLLSLIEIPKHPKAETIALSLLCDILDWRKLLEGFTHEELESRVTMVNHQVAKQASQQGCGIIFAHFHYQLIRGAETVFNNLGFSISEELGAKRVGDDIKQFGLERDEKSEALVFGYHIHRAQQSLKQGGIFHISPDGFWGISEGITIPFYGKNRVFRTTFAELALSTGAKVICTFMSVDTSGQIKLEFFGPLDPGTPEQSHEARVEGLVRQYVDWLGRIWAEHPAQLRLHIMARHFALPPAP